MRDFRDAKAMAQTLRDALKTKSVSITHGESLELIAKVLQDPTVLKTLAASAKPAEAAKPSPSDKAAS